MVSHLLVFEAEYPRSSSSQAMPATVCLLLHSATVGRRIFSLETHREGEEALPSAESVLAWKGEVHFLRHLPCPLSERLTLVS